MPEAMRFIALLLFAASFTACASLGPYPTPDEREAYIANHNVPDTIATAIRTGDVIPGMTRDQVIATMGDPHRINTTQTTNGVRRQLIYTMYRPYDGRGDGTVYVYLENGTVTAVQY